MLDTDKTPRKKTWSSRNVIHQKNNENIKDSKEVKPRSNGYGRIQKIPTQNHQEETTTVVGHINRADGIEKQLLSGQICGTKSRGRQRTKYNDGMNNFVTRKESPNKEFIRRTGNGEDWKGMITYVCNRSITDGQSNTFNQIHYTLLFRHREPKTGGFLLNLVLHELD